jgi:hypothetical protein
MAPKKRPTKKAPAKKPAKKKAPAKRVKKSQEYFSAYSPPIPVKSGPVPASLKYDKDEFTWDASLSPLKRLVNVWLSFFRKK